MFIIPVEFTNNFRWVYSLHFHFGFMYNRTWQQYVMADKNLKWKMIAYINVKDYSNHDISYS